MRIFGLIQAKFNLFLMKNATIYLRYEMNYTDHKEPLARQLSSVETRYAMGFRATYLLTV
jgi:hypothetical protein